MNIHCLIYIFLLFFSISLFSQEPDNNQLIVVKLKEEYRSKALSNTIDNVYLQKFVQNGLILSIERMFPNHKPPEVKFDDNNHILVDLSLIYLIRVADISYKHKIINSLFQTGFFEYIESYPIPNKLENSFYPNDPYINNQYYLSKIQAFEAWYLHKGDTNFVMGIVDTGYDFTHPDLVNAVKYNNNDPIDGLDNDNDGFVDNYKGWNLGMNNNNPQYGNIAHGVHVSGIAGASTNNGFGIAGIGFNSKILPVRVDNQHGSLIMAYPGIIYAADHGAKVINCSWGSTGGYSQFSQDIINYATYNRKALVVAAAGNSNNEVPFYPCAYNNVLCIAATKANDLKWENSSYYNRVDICAPGHSIYSTWVNGTFVSSSGTSMAAPIVSGSAALVWSFYPTLLPQQIKEHLKNSSEDIYHLPENMVYRDKLGYGRLNLYKALTDSIKPGIQLLSFQVIDNNDNYINFNDTIFITGQFINYLAPTNNLQIRLKVSSQYIQLIDSVYDATIIETMQQFTNHIPFSARILPQTPDDHKILLKFEYIDQDYFGYNFAEITVNKSYLNLDTNLIQTTITSHGMLGYNDYTTFTQGIGFRFGNSANLSSCIGFFFGRSPQQVSDRLYGFTTTFDQDLTSVINASYVKPAVYGHQQISGVFNDQEHNNPIGINVHFDAFAFDEHKLKNCIFLKYSLKNVTSSTINDLHVGFFSDWDLKQFNFNKASTLNSQKAGYVYSSDNTLFASIQLLSETPFRHYAIDNNGADGSINLKDGMTDLEKYMLLTNTRQTAGNSPNGNDVSSVIATGPFSLNSEEQKEVVYAIHVTSTMQEMLNSLSNALAKWQQIQTSDVTKNKLPPDEIISVYPNPANNCLFISNNPTNKKIRYLITDLTGRFIQSGNYLSDCINILSLESGFYIITIFDDNSVIVKKFIKK